MAILSDGTLLRVVVTLWGTAWRPAMVTSLLFLVSRVLGWAVVKGSHAPIILRSSCVAWNYGESPFIFVNSALPRRSTCISVPVPSYF